MTLPPLPAIGSARIEVYGALGAGWDEANWDNQVRSELDWVDITPESMSIRTSWGADDPVGTGAGRKTGAPRRQPRFAYALNLTNAGRFRP